MSYSITTAVKKIAGMKKKIRDVRGGTGAGKTIGVIIWDIDYAQRNKKKIIDIVSSSYPHLDQGVMRDFKSIMQAQNYWQDSLWNETHHFYTFETGTELHFQSFDKLGKAHGPRRDVLHLNEANFLPWNVVDQLITRTREVVWAEYNPSAEFWMHENILGKRDDVEQIKLTYLDNEALSENEVREIEAHKGNVRWWRVYGEGEYGEIEGRIYTGWNWIDTIPHEARLERRWLDFGYTNDPSAIGDMYYHNGGLVLDEQLYQRGLSNRQLAEAILNMPRPHTLVIADSAEPKSIDEIRSFGVNIMPAQKGKDSVKFGITIMQNQQISATNRSFNLRKEYNNYMFLIDKDGRVLNEEDPICANHHMAGLRYAGTSLIPIIQRKEFIANMPRFYREEKKWYNKAI